MSIATSRAPIHSNLPEDLRDRLESILENNSLLSRQLREGRLEHYQVLDTTEYLPRLDQCARVVSDACTKLAIQFSKPPLPSAQDCGVICSRLENAVLVLVSTCNVFPEAQGCALKKEVQRVVLDILDGVSLLTRALMEEGCAGASKLKGAGSVWEACDSVAKLPKDNRSAVLKVFIAQLHLLKDVCAQVDELVTSNGTQHRMEQAEAEAHAKNGSNGWAPYDRDLALPCIKIIKTAVEVAESVSRVVVSHGSVGEERSVQELDIAAEEVLKLSPLADDLAEELEAPLDHKKCVEIAANLASVIVEFLKTVDEYHFCAAAGQSWQGATHQQTVTETVASLGTRRTR